MFRNNIKMVSAIVLKVFLLLFINNWCLGTDVQRRPLVTMELSQSGMHRDLVYTIEFESPWVSAGCEYILEQNFPAAVYISVDQLDDLRRLNKLSALYPHFVDVELPTEKSKPFKVLLSGEAKKMDTVSLPIHYRYHAPAKSKKFVNVALDTPKMYISCPSTKGYLFESELAETTNPDTNYCLDEKNLEFKSFLDEDWQDDLFTSESCQWKPIQIDLQLKTTTTARIPVGDSESLPFVLVLTIIVSWAVSIWTVYRTHSVPYNINNRLNQQYLAQNKKDL